GPVNDHSIPSRSAAANRARISPNGSHSSSRSASGAAKSWNWRTNPPNSDALTRQPSSTSWNIHSVTTPVDVTTGCTSSDRSAGGPRSGHPGGGAPPHELHRPSDVRGLRRRPSHPDHEPPLPERVQRVLPEPQQLKIWRIHSQPRQHIERRHPGVRLLPRHEA